MPKPSSTEAGATILLEHVSKQYPNQEMAAVSDLSLSIKAGEFVVLVGPSGCGKTTTLRMINRLVEPTEGKIWINGEDVTNANVDLLRRGIGYVIQSVGLLPHLTVADNVGLVPKMNGVPKAERLKNTHRLLELVGLDPTRFAARYPRQLSGGQQQRIGVARALAADPPIMLMDEPFAAVDPITRTKLQTEFLRLQKQLRKTIVFVTHDIDEALRLGDRIAIFQQSSGIAQFATPLEILTTPANQFVKDFVGGGAAVRRLALVSVRDVSLGLGTQAGQPLANPVAVTADTTVQEALERALEARADGVCVTAENGVSNYINLQQLLLGAANTATASR